MAEDTAALVVALSAQLTKFEKDMSQAVGIAGKKTKEIEGKFATMNKAINTQLTVLTNSLAGNLGGVGSILTSFGKGGLIAAAGVGAAAAAMLAAIGIAQRFAEQADRLDQSSQNIGVSITQLKALGEAGKAANQDFERTHQAFTKFIGNVEALKEAQGPLYEALRKTDKALLLQLTNASNSAEAIEVLVKAFGKLETQTEKIALARAAGFTRGGVGTLQEIFDRGNLSGLTQGLKNIDEATKKIADMKNELEKLSQTTFDLIGGLVTEGSLNLLKNAHREFQGIVDTIEKIRNFDFRSLFRPPGPSNVQAVADAAARGRTVPAADQALRSQLAPVKLAPTADQELDTFKRAVSVMGDAVTLAEQYTLKQKELAVAVKEGDITEAQRKRTLDAMNLTQKIAIATTLERLGIADRESIVAGKLAEIDALRAKGLITQTQATQAITLAMREANEEADKLAVRRSYFPGLTQLGLDIQRVEKELDKFGVQTLGNLENAFIDAASGTKTLSDAFREMVSSILKDLARLLIRQTITGPLATLLGGLGGTSGGVPIFAPGNAAGTSNWGGGWTWVGEKGPELVNLPKGSQVVPNDVSRGGVGGVSVGVTSTIVVQGDASEKTLMLIEGALARQKRELPNDIIKTVQQMRSRRA